MEWGRGLHHAHRAALHGSIVGSQHKSDPTTLLHKDMPELRQMNPPKTIFTPDQL